MWIRCPIEDRSRSPCSQLQSCEARSWLLSLLTAVCFKHAIGTPRSFRTSKDTYISKTPSCGVAYVTNRQQQTWYVTVPRSTAVSKRNLLSSKVKHVRVALCCCFKFPNKPVLADQKLQLVTKWRKSREVQSRQSKYCCHAVLFHIPKSQKDSPQLLKPKNTKKMWAPLAVLKLQRGWCCLLCADI